MNWQDVIWQVGGFLLPVVSTVLVAVLTALAKKWLDKLNVERSAKIDDMIDKYVKIGIDYVDKLVENKVKESQQKIASNDKLNMAVSTVMAELEQSGIKGVAESLVVARIEAALGVRDSTKETSKSTGGV